MEIYHKEKQNCLIRQQHQDLEFSFILQREKEIIGGNFVGERGKEMQEGEKKEEKREGNGDGQE